MKLFRISVVAIGVIGMSFFCRAAEPVSGAWILTETAEGKKTEWNYDLISDGEEMLVGVGFPMGEAGDLDDILSLDSIIDSEEILKLAFVVLQKQEDGNYEGFFIEADGKGKQVSFGLEGRAGADGKSLSLTGRNQLGEEIMSAEGRIFVEADKGKVQAGKWLIREVVVPQRGGWDIAWDFQFTAEGGELRGTGNKVAVNHEDAQPGEKKTTLQISLDVPDEKGRVEGKGVETNAKGNTIETEYIGWVAPSGDWFFIQSFEDGETTSLLHGTR